MSIAQFDERVVNNSTRLVVPADGTALLPLVTVGVGDRRVDALLVSNRDTIAHVVNIVLTHVGVLTVLGSTSVPAGAGFAGAPSVDIMAASFPSTQVGMNLTGADLLGVQLAVAVAATFDVSVTAVGGLF